MPPHVYIGLGSNLGDRAGNLLMGIRGLIEDGLKVGRLSRIYETEPFETIPQPAYLNMIAEIDGSGIPAPEDLMVRLLNVEASLGRTREIAGGPRSIDLDLLLFGDQVRDSNLLRLPHPGLHRRRFILVPLMELAPDFVHPTLNKPLNEILEALEDRSGVELWSP